MSFLKEETVLISVKAFTSEGEELVKNVLRELQKVIQIERLSSVYRIEGKVNENRHIHDLRTEASYKGLCLVIKAQSKNTPESLMQKMKEIELELRSEVLYRNLSMNILVFGENTQMSPKLTLPYPELHNRPEELVPAAELWPSYVHPILGKSLQDLSQKFISAHWGEFYEQGKSLLDF